MKYLGIDYGLRKMGLAIGDDETRVAAPLEVIESDNPVESISRIISEEGIEAVVLGLPKTDAGYSKEQLGKTQKFADELRSSTSIPIYTADESFSSVESQRIQQESGSKVPEDALAAMLILQGYFNEGDSAGQ